jgi:hypothetical protein
MDRFVGVRRDASVGIAQRAPCSPPPAPNEDTSIAAHSARIQLVAVNEA